MSPSAPSQRQAHRLLQSGALLFLLALLVGLVIHRFALPRVALSAHLVGLLQGIFLLVVGLLWPQLELGPAASRTAFFLLLYGSFVSWTVTVLAAAWGAGGQILSMAAGQAQGTALQERIVVLGLQSAAAAMIAALLLILWGLRSPAFDPTDRPG
jgi:hydroxylaminobenzene mutase